MQVQSEGRYGAALASLAVGDAAAARRWIESARQCRFPLQDSRNSALSGIVSYGQSDLTAAKRAFVSAVEQAGAVLATGPELYAALDAKAIALCGLALCGDTEQTIAARAAFRAARAVTSAAGVVRKVLQLFDALALADESRVLADIRPDAAGDNAERPDASRPLRSTIEGGRVGS